MDQPCAFYEIELKSLLTKEQYNRLYDELPRNMKVINRETIHTTRYRPGDVRLRHSDKTIELVGKQGDATQICRKEIKIPLASKEKMDHLAQVFALLNLQPDPPWTKHKIELEHKYNGFTYIVCLQHIENFAYVLEVEFLSPTDDSHTHEPNLRAIVKTLGCEPIEPKDFLNKISEYIKQNQKIN